MIDFELPSLAALQAFERAAARSSFASAARDLGRTPSAVSHAIKELEEKLGIDLFERVGRSVTLTRAGRAYLESIQPPLSDLRVATRRVMRARDEKTIRISALPFFASAVLLPALGQFEQDYPDYDLRIETSNHYADVLNDEADIALRFGEENSRDLIVKPLLTVYGLPVAAPSYLKKSPKLKKIEDLSRHTLLHVHQTPLAWSEWYKAQGGDDDLVTTGQNLSFDSMLGVLDAVKNGLGIGLSMYPLIGHYQGFGTEFVSIFKPALANPTKYNFVCRRSSTSEPKIHHTLTWLESTLANLAD